MCQIRSGIRVEVSNTLAGLGALGIWLTVSLFVGIEQSNDNSLGCILQRDGVELKAFERGRTQFDGGWHVMYPPICL